MSKVEPTAWGWQIPDGRVLLAAVSGTTVEEWREEVRKRKGYSVVPLYTLDAAREVLAQALEEWVRTRHGETIVAVGEHDLLRAARHLREGVEP